MATAKAVALAMHGLRLLQIVWLFQIVVIFSIVLLAMHSLRLTSGMQLTSVLIRYLIGAYTDHLILGGFSSENGGSV